MMSETMSSSSLKKLEDIKTTIRALLISMGSRDVTLPKLNKIYKEEMDEDIPYKDFYYTSLKEFLNSMPEVLHLEYNNNNQLCAYHIDTEKTKHVSSLVARQKKDSKSKKSKFNHRRQNLVNPAILKTVLEDLTKSSSNINLGISKTTVLSKILNHLGRGAIYNMDDLNSQLIEFSHLLINDDNYIYFKNTSSNNKEKSRESNIKKTNVLNLQSIGRENTMFSNSAGDLVKESTKKRLQNLIEKYTDGIWCYELPTLYIKEYGLDLEYIDLGFSCIIEFVGALPNIFKIIKGPNVRKVKVIDARKSETLLTNNQAFDFNNELITCKTNEPPAIPLKNLSPIVSKKIIPDDFMSIDDTIDHIRVSSLYDNPTDFIDVIVSEVFSPTKFWIILRKNKGKREKMMNLLQQFYNLRNIEKYEVPPILIQKGLHIACTFNDIWHRAIIKKVKPDEVDVYFYDYGTTYSYKPNQLYFLNMQFSIVPAQAIPCSLYNVKPIGRDKWCIAVVKQFVEKVMERSFVASIVNVNEENNSMNINLIDTKQGADEVYVNNWMVTNKLAHFGIFRCTLSNIAFKQYLECTKKKDFLDTECTVNVIPEKILSDSISNESNNFSPNVMSSKKKLEVLKRYQKRLSTSLQSSSSGLNNESISPNPSPEKKIYSDYKLLLSKDIKYSNNTNSEENQNLNCKIKSSLYANYKENSADNEKQIGQYSKNDTSIPLSSSFTCLDNDSSTDKGKSSISSIREKLLNRYIANSNNENGTNDIKLYNRCSITNFSNSSLYPSSLSNDSFKSDSFNSDIDSCSEVSTCNSLMFQYCSEPVIIGVTNSKSSKIRVSSKKNGNIHNPLTELQKLMSSTTL